MATVSNIINEKGKVSEETRIRVQKIIEEMNYTPNSVAKNLKTKNSRCIGVIAEDMTVFALPDIIDGITEYCEKEDYQILLVNLRLYKKFEDTYYRSDRYGDIVQREIQKLVAKQVEGIIYVAAHERLINVFPEQLPVPMVVAYGYTSHRGIPSVMVSDEQGARELVKYLISMGHRRIGVIAGKKYSMHTRSRLEGYQRALFEGNVLYDPDLVVYGDWERESGFYFRWQQSCMTAESISVLQTDRCVPMTLLWRRKSSVLHIWNVRSWRIRFYTIPIRCRPMKIWRVISAVRVMLSLQNFLQFYAYPMRWTAAISRNSKMCVQQ